MAVEQAVGSYKSDFSGQSGLDAAPNNAMQRILNTDGSDLKKGFKKHKRKDDD